MSAPPAIVVREWSRSTPASPDVGRVLRGRCLNDADRELLADLGRRARLRIEELRSGLLIETQAHIGTVTLSCLRLSILPKIRIENLMRMVAYAFELDNLVVSKATSQFRASDHGLTDLLGLSLLHAVQRIARGGLLPNYERRTEDLASPRGRIDLRHVATHPRRMTLRCTFDDLTADHLLNQVLAAGLRLAARVMASANLRIDLARAADRFFGELRRVPLSADLLRQAREALDRRSNHYETALQLVALIFEGSRLEEHAPEGQVPLSSFMLNMNAVFERFLERHLREHAPGGILVSGQEVRPDVFAYLDNPSGWGRPSIRPDLVFRHFNRVVAVGDVKYKNRHEHPPTSAELYQLTTYGLAYRMPEPREVLLFHPLGTGEKDLPTRLLFAPGAAANRVQIRLVGVPIDAVLAGEQPRWWPALPVAGSASTAA